MNENEIHHCPRCGAELPASAPEQPCPACLMKLGLESWVARSGEPEPAQPFSARLERFCRRRVRCAGRRNRRFSPDLEQLPQIPWAARFHAPAKLELAGCA